MDPKGVYPINLMLPWGCKHLPFLLMLRKPDIPFLFFKDYTSPLMTLAVMQYKSLN